MTNIFLKTISSPLLSFRSFKMFYYFFPILYSVFQSHSSIISSPNFSHLHCYLLNHLLTLCFFFLFPCPFLLSLRYFFFLSLPPSLHPCFPSFDPSFIPFFLPSSECQANYPGLAKSWTLVENLRLPLH